MNGLNELSCTPRAHALKKHRTETVRWAGNGIPPSAAHFEHLSKKPVEILQNLADAYKSIDLGDVDETRRFRRIVQGLSKGHHSLNEHEASVVNTKR